MLAAVDTIENENRWDSCRWEAYSLGYLSLIVYPGWACWCRHLGQHCYQSPLQRTSQEVTRPFGHSYTTFTFAAVQESQVVRTFLSFYVQNSPSFGESVFLLLEAMKQNKVEFSGYFIETDIDSVASAFSFGPHLS